MNGDAISLDNDGHFDGNSESITDQQQLKSFDVFGPLPCFGVVFKIDSASSPCRCRCFPLTTKVAKSREPKRRYAFEHYWQLQPQKPIDRWADCAIFNSLTKPIKLIINGKRGQFGVSYKAGDDLRQDAVVLQLVRAMNDIWLSVQLDFRMVLFRCLPTGSKKGLMIELVPSCKTLREIQIVSSGAAAVFKDEVLNEWLARQKPYEAALENVPAFVCRLVCGHLCAGYWRPAQRQHFGHVFHIDFGKYIGDWQMAAGFKWCAIKMNGDAISLDNDGLMETANRSLMRDAM
ncbi:hypothetical protein niasHS_009583 [Heterodera schachtii]|uniref:PI3K/PI4K catalytic domain-containing protein n=1 Tax=Heterodera schachtii TaxID=97005 RepID=A0ABD2JBA2_HETSC